MPGAKGSRLASLKQGGQTGFLFPWPGNAKYPQLRAKFLATVAISSRAVVTASDQANDMTDLARMVAGGGMVDNAESLQPRPIAPLHLGRLISSVLIWTSPWCRGLVLGRFLVRQSGESGGLSDEAA